MMTGLSFEHRTALGAAQGCVDDLLALLIQHALGDQVIEAVDQPGGHIGISSRLGLLALLVSFELLAIALQAAIGPAVHRAAAAVIDHCDAKSCRAASRVAAVILRPMRI